MWATTYFQLRVRNGQAPRLSLTQNLERSRAASQQGDAKPAFFWTRASVDERILTSRAWVREWFSAPQPGNSSFSARAEVSRNSLVFTFATSELAGKRARRKAAGELAVEGPMERLCADRGFGKCIAIDRPIGLAEIRTCQLGELGFSLGHVGPAATPQPQPRPQAPPACRAPTRRPCPQAPSIKP